MVSPESPRQRARDLKYDLRILSFARNNSPIPWQGMPVIVLTPAYAQSLVDLTLNSILFLRYWERPDHRVPADIALATGRKPEGARMNTVNGRELNR